MSILCFIQSQPKLSKGKFLYDVMPGRLIERTFKYVLIDSCFVSYFSVRGSRPGKNVQLTEPEIRGLCLKSREIFLSQPILLELEAPLKICGKCFLAWNS